MPDNPNLPQPADVDQDVLVELLDANEEQVLGLMARIHSLLPEQEAIQGDLPDEEVAENETQNQNENAPQTAANLREMPEIARLERILGAMERLRITLDESTARVAALNAFIDNRVFVGGNDLFVDDEPHNNGGNGLFVSDDDEPHNNDEAANANLQVTLVETPLDDAMAGSEKTAPCAICKEEVSVGEPVLVLPCAAKHWYHPDCAREWLQYARTCPSCRGEL